MQRVNRPGWGEWGSVQPPHSHASKAPGGICLLLPLGSLGSWGFGLQGMASTSAVTDKHNYPSLLPLPGEITETEA